MVSKRVLLAIRQSAGILIPALFVQEYTAGNRRQRMFFAFRAAAAARAKAKSAHAFQQTKPKLSKRRRGKQLPQFRHWHPSEAQRPARRRGLAGSL